MGIEFDATLVLDKQLLNTRCDQINSVFFYVEQEISGKVVFKKVVARIDKRTFIAYPAYNIYPEDRWIYVLRGNSVVKVLDLQEGLEFFSNH